MNEFTYYLTPFSVKKDVYHDKQNPIFIVGSWLGNDNENTNSQFIREYKEEYNSTPTVFSLLGYENALVLKTIIKSENLDNSYTSLLNKMKKLHLEGPRGTIFFEEKSNRTIFNHYLYKMLTYDESDFSYQKVETLENYGSFIQNVLFQESPAQPGGWQNAYLCH